MNFQRFGFLTLVAIYLLIFVGGVVRSTGSGMGCPDWPKCFGSWVPPTDIKELPLNYQEIYGSKLKGEVIFNPVKTWIEYLNRLLGALIGLLVFGTFLFSTKYWKSNKLVSLWSAIAVILTGIQGWIGSKVVSSELTEYMVTIHMIIAIAIVFLLIYVLVLVNDNSDQKAKNLYLNTSYIWFVLLITLIQILFGTQVREKIDQVAKLFGENERGIWVENLGIKFLIHRSFSIIVLFATFYLFFKLKKITTSNDILKKINNWLFAVIVLEIFTGIILNYLNFPAIIQPVHLTLATIVVGGQFYLLLIIQKQNNLVSNKNAVNIN